MVRDPDAGSVVGDFADGEFRLPADSPDPLAGEVVARTFQRDGRYYMALRHPEKPEFVGFPIRYVLGYQYRQEYLFREADGVLRRLPLQWSTAKQAFFPYWNIQENSEQTLPDLWAQMETKNSAWNLYCARCHTTNLEIHERDEWHTRANVTWQEKGIGCELNTGLWDRTRTHEMSSLPNPQDSVRFGLDQAPNACSDCHGDWSPDDLVRIMQELWPGSVNQILNDRIADF